MPISDGLRNDRVEVLFPRPEVVGLELEIDPTPTEVSVYIVLPPPMGIKRRKLRTIGLPIAAQSCISVGAHSLSSSR
jgi:hypothetical protein